jgi:DNA-directed RNA polymerase subunit RPC12/RpoP
MNIIKMKCSNCGADLELDLDHLMIYCPYCGEKLLIDVGNYDNVLVEKEKTKQKNVDIRLKELENERDMVYQKQTLLILFVCLAIFLISMLTLAFS